MKKTYYFNIFLIFIISITTNFYFGSIGVFPIDTFAFFDSANFINKGFLPIRDYWTSNGFLVDLIQSVFFKFFGTNWTVYLLHSSLVNFFLAYLTYKFLLSENLKPIHSLFYSISVAILAYPSAGVPFSDHHSLIFSIISIFLLIFFIKKKLYYNLYLSIFFLIIAFLCKQVPAGLFFIFCTAIILIFSFKTKNFSYFKNSFLFSIILLSIIAASLIITQIGIKNFLVQYIYFPLTIGGERSMSFELKYLIKSFTGEYKYFLLLIFALLYQSYRKSKKINILDTNIILILASIISIFNQEIMKNQNIIFFLLPILIAIFQSKINLKDKSRRNLLIIFIVTFNIFIVSKYNERFNIDRKFMDLQDINKQNYVMAERISKNLKGLRWVSLASETYLKNEIILLKKSMEYLKQNSDNSFIITEYQFINSEINSKIYSPNRWYTTDGVSYPLKKNKYRKYYLKFYKDKIIKNDIEKIFTIYPLNENVFDFVLKKDCFTTTRINEILFEHKLNNCKD
tara:strand:- start:1223 stop:2758 length:1536 start_codon:yes stop_codon:yes gene_type:complete